MRLWLLVALAGCNMYGGDAPPHIGGAVKLAVDVDPTAFATVEIRGYASNGPGEPAQLEPSYRASLPIENKGFPRDFFIEEELYGGSYVHMRAWLASEPNAVGTLLGEPYGKAIAELCECATHAPASADVDIVIDRFVE